MTDNVYLLRPNTFFLLLLRAGKQDLGQSTGWAKSTGLTESNLMADLIRVGYPDFTVKNPDTLPTYMSGFKAGNSRFANSKTYFPFAGSVCRGAYIKTMADDKEAALNRMQALCDKYLDLKSGANKELLAGGLIELLQSEGLDPVFDFGSCQKPISEIETIEEISLYPFLLSVWYYVVVNLPDSTEAACFNESIGEATAAKISVTLDLPQENKNAASASSEEETNAANDQTDTSEAGPEIIDDFEANSQGKPSEQILVNNGRIYQQHAEKITNIEYVENLTI